MKIELKPTLAIKTKLNMATTWDSDLEKIDYTTFNPYYNSEWGKILNGWPVPSEVNVDKYRSLTSVVNDENELQFTYNLAGTPEKDIEISVENNKLIVWVNGLEKKRNSLLEESYDLKKAKAEYKDGLLTVTLPKKVPQKKIIKIE